MHEVGIAKNAVDAAIKHAQMSGANRITEIHLRIGVMAGVVPEALDFAYEAVTRGTMAEGSQMVVETVGIRCRCEQCDIEFDSEGAVFRCPRCNEPSATIISGREMLLVQVMVG